MMVVLLLSRYALALPASHHDWFAFAAMPFAITGNDFTGVVTSCAHAVAGESLAVRPSLGVLWKMHRPHLWQMPRLSLLLAQLPAMRPRHESLLCALWATVHAPLLHLAVSVTVLVAI